MELFSTSKTQSFVPGRGLFHNIAHRRPDGKGAGRLVGTPCLVNWGGEGGQLPLSRAQGTIRIGATLAVW